MTDLPAAPATKPKKATNKKRRKRRRNPLVWFLLGLARRIYFGVKTASRVVYMENGYIVEQGDASCFANPQTDAFKNYLSH